MVQKDRFGVGEGDGGGVEAEEEVEAGAESLQRKKNKKEAKMRITSDGLGAAGVGTKRTFDEDGTAVVSFLLW